MNGTGTHGFVREDYEAGDLIRDAFDESIVGLVVGVERGYYSPGNVPSFDRLEVIWSDKHKGWPDFVPSICVIGHDSFRKVAP